MERLRSHGDPSSRQFRMPALSRGHDLGEAGSWGDHRRRSSGDPDSASFLRSRRNRISCGRLRGNVRIPVLALSRHELPQLRETHFAGKGPSGQPNLTARTRGQGRRGQMPSCLNTPLPPPSHGVARQELSPSIRAHRKARSPTRPSRGTRCAQTNRARSAPRAAPTAAARSWRCREVSPSSSWLAAIASFEQDRGRFSPASSGQRCTT